MRGTDFSSLGLLTGEDWQERRQGGQAVGLGCMTSMMEGSDQMWSELNGPCPPLPSLRGRRRAGAMKVLRGATPNKHISRPQLLFSPPHPGSLFLIPPQPNCPSPHFPDHPTPSP